VFTYKIHTSLRSFLLRWLTIVFLNKQKKEMSITQARPFLYAERASEKFSPPPRVLDTVMPKSL